MLGPESGLVRGTLDVLILKAVSWGPRHGTSGPADGLQLAAVQRGVPAHGHALGPHRLAIAFELM